MDINLFIPTNSSVPSPLSLSSSLVTLLDPFGKWFMSATNHNHPAMQSPRTWFVSWKSYSKKLSGNALDGSSSAGTCYMLHVVLFVIHVVFVISYIFHWEYRLTLPFKQRMTVFGLWY
ncbi:hypothetical protein BDR03DRAFT_77371 [Suillus americanus]|nr:hypothetical protein BDR03DRAFT_77371 [Suillus americanus]